MKVNNKQTLIDIAIITKGDPLAAFDIALENNISITDSINEVETHEIVNTTTNYYKINKFKPATGYTEEPYKIFDFTFDETFE